MSILKYFKPKNIVIPSPEGPLSCKVPLSSIHMANRSINTIFESGAGMTTMKEKKGKYKKYSPKEKTNIGNYIVYMVHNFMVHSQNFYCKNYTF